MSGMEPRREDRAGRATGRTGEPGTAQSPRPCTSTARLVLPGSRTCTPALPFCHLRLSAPKPTPEGSPEAPQTLGQHLRRRRMDLGLRQVDLAKQFGVDAATLYNWEEGQTSPQVRLMARVIAFIGCDPTPAETSLPSRLRAYRRREGLSQRAMAARLGVQADTAARWEWRGQKPRAEHWATIDRVLGPAEPTPQDLPNRIRHIRRKLGLTQEEFGRRLGLGQHCISSWERGECEPLPVRRAQLDRMLAQIDS